MSKRLREKRNRRVNAATLLRRISPNGEWPGMACSYGAHSWKPDFASLTKTCTACGGVYSITEREADSWRAWLGTLA